MTLAPKPTKILAVREIGTEDIAGLLLRDGLNPFQYFDIYDPDKVFELFQKLTCPAPCIGFVNKTGWHQECQLRAQEAMTALGLIPPPIDSIPEKDDDE